MYTFDRYRRNAIKSHIESRLVAMILSIRACVSTNLYIRLKMISGNPEID